MRYRDRHTAQERRALAGKIRSVYGTDYTAMLIEHHPLDRVLPTAARTKFLVPADVTFAWVVAKVRAQMSSSAALFLFVEMPNGSHVVPNGADSMARLATIARHDDGFVYALYAGENTFGEDADPPPLPSTHLERLLYYYRDYRPADPPFYMPLTALAGGRFFGHVTFRNGQCTPPIMHRGYVCVDGTEIYDPLLATTYPGGTTEWVDDLSLQ